MLVCAQYLIKYGTNDRPIGLYHPQDGTTNLKYKWLCLLTPNKKNSKRKALAFNRDRCCHLALCLQLILFHYINFGKMIFTGFGIFLNCGAQC
jgi:hypothetical protein